MKRKRNPPKRRPKTMRDREMKSIKLCPVDYKRLERDTTAFLLGHAIMNFAEETKQ